MNKAKTHRIVYMDGVRWVDMGSTPLKYSVHGDGAQGKLVMIPARAKGVLISFGTCSRTYVDRKTGKVKHMNRYRWNGKEYHGY